MSPYRPKTSLVSKIRAYTFQSSVTPATSVLSSFRFPRVRWRVRRVEKVGRGDCSDRGEGEEGREKGEGRGEGSGWRRMVRTVRGRSRGGFRPGTRIENSSHFVADDG